MKLRNKKTGEIVEWFNNTDGIFPDSLAELNKDWEDYEEPEEDFWYIDSDCETYGVSRAFNQNDSDDVLFNKSIGNYFETREEAEKTVERLRAWKRLKDKGFRFKLSPAVGSLDINPDKFQIEVNADMPVKWFTCDAVQKDLEACFGGEG